MKLDERDVRAMVRLVGEVAALPGGHAEKKRFLMEGLCRLIQADAWAWGLSCQREPHQPQVYVSILTGGFTDDSLVKFLHAIEHPGTIELSARFFQEVEQQQTHLTRARQQIVDDAAFTASPAHLAWKEADLGPIILSLRPLDERSGSMVALYRKYDREHFTPRESRIAHIILTEVPWLHELGWPEDRGVTAPALSRRERLALNLLLVGRSRKQIADQMKISPNTVQGYIKVIYRHFGVNSHAELMNRFLQGNGRDMV